jgi:hypothetical protein
VSHDLTNPADVTPAMVAQLDPTRTTAPVQPYSKMERRLATERELLAKMESMVSSDAMRKAIRAAFVEGYQSVERKRKAVPA